MDTTTMNTEDTMNAQTTSDRKPPFQLGLERTALRRPFSDRMLTGVCAGLGRYFGIDTTIVRIAFVVLTVIGGAGIPLYLAALLLIPDEGSDQSIASSIIGSFQH